jgi:hypothetical protein
MGIFGLDFHDFNAAQAGVFRGQQIMIYTANGAYVTMWEGYAADMARELCSQFAHFAFQPVAFDPKPVPMKQGVEEGVAEFVRQLTVVHPTGPFMIIVYSEGAIIGSRVYDMLRDPTSSIAHRRKDLLAAVAIGNPRREEGHLFPGAIPVSGFGIVEPNLVGTEELWWDFANGDETPGSGGEDLYATSSDAKGAALSNMRAIWKIVWNGNPLTLAAEIAKAIFMPWRLPGAVQAMSKAAKFFGAGTRPHIDYQESYPIAGDPRDSWRIAFDYLAGVGAKVVAGKAFTARPPEAQRAMSTPLFPPIRSK